MSDAVKRSRREDEAGDSEVIPAKKAKRMCRYRAAWAVEFPWSSKTADDEFAANCLLCRQTLSVASGGRSDLLRHAETEHHSAQVVPELWKWV